MQVTDTAELYPTYRQKTERWALGLVLLVVLGLPLGILAYRQLALRLAPVRVVEMTGRLPTASQGGWTPETVVVQKGERVRLRLSSTDVIHGFAIPKLGIEIDWVEPGKVTEVEFVAEQPGRYDFLCTVWCQDGHWRMRGALEVVDPADPQASAQDVDPPSTNWMAAGIDIDAEHPGENAPLERPVAARGEALFQSLVGRPVDQWLPGLDLRRDSPSQIYAYLQQRSELDSLSSEEKWDLVAFLWLAATTPEGLAAGERLYQRDCTGCHGPQGRGDGPGAEALGQGQEMESDHQHQGMARPATDFGDLVAQAGASDLLYYGKMVRGGMGTSMPYWGTIYTEQELWDVIAYLRSLAFQFPEP